MTNKNIQVNARCDVVDIATIMEYYSGLSNVPWLTRSNAIRIALFEHVNILVRDGMTERMTVDKATQYLKMKNVPRDIAVAISTEDDTHDEQDVDRIKKAIDLMEGEQGETDAHI